MVTDTLEKARDLKRQKDEETALLKRLPELQEAERQRRFEAIRQQQIAEAHEYIRGLVPRMNDAQGRFAKAITAMVPLLADAASAQSEFNVCEMQISGALGPSRTPDTIQGWHALLRQFGIRTLDLGLRTSDPAIQWLSNAANGLVRNVPPGIISTTPKE